MRSFGMPAEKHCPLFCNDALTKCMFELIEKKFNENKTVTPGNLVLLAHDEMFRNGWEESELKELIDKLKATGKYSFEHLSTYPE